LVAAGACLGFGTAALLVSALFGVRLWRRRHYVPGSGLRADLDESPVVRGLTFVYNDTLTAFADGDVGEPSADRSPPRGSPEAVGRRRAQALAARVAPPPGHLVVGTWDGRPLALDLAATRGIGLVGPGAASAVRALVLALLAERHRPDAVPVEVLIPTKLATRLLDDQVTARPPERLRLFASTDELLDLLETQLVSRARTAATDADPRAGEPATLVAVAAPSPALDGRMRAILDTGSACGFVGIFYGPWQSGATARVRIDGTVSAAAPATLVGSKLFTLPAGAATDLVTLLADADPAAASHEAFRRANPGPPEPPAGPGPARTRDLGSVPRPPGQAADSARQNTEPAPLADRPDQEQLAPERSAASTSATSAAPASPSALADPDPAGRSVAPAPTTPFVLTVLGTACLLHRPDAQAEYKVVKGLTPKVREILAYLALHPDGVRRNALLAALWPNGDDEQVLANRFDAALSHQRRVLRGLGSGAAGNLVERAEGRVWLRRDLVTADVWRVHSALDQYRRSATAATVLPVIAAYTDHLAEELDAAWALPHRENLRRGVLDALTDALSTLEPDNPTQHLALLEQLRTLDPDTETTYCKIAEVRAELGDLDAVRRTYDLLCATLAASDDHPDPHTVAVFEKLLRGQPPGTSDPRDARSA
ncbi:hypothetical protein I7412_00715, partial [Frankia sp. CN6]|nr:hypothetical protein [Frankia nepalensis]